MQNLLFILLFLLPQQVNKPLTEEQKIDQLISYIETMKDVVFVRNDTEYSAKQAAEHLRMKREKAGTRVKTAREFIEKVGSKSYLSGENYMIKFKSGNKVTSQFILMKELERIEKLKENK